MPAAFMMIGGLMMLVAVFGEPKDLERLLAEDIKPGSSLFALVGVAAGVSAIGFYKPFEGLSRTFLALTFVALVARDSAPLIKLLNEGPKIPGGNKAPENKLPPKGQQNPPTMKDGLRVRDFPINPGLG